jgi:hypothetical protein
MSDLVEDSRLHSELRQAGLKRAHQFNWSRTAQSTIEVLNKYL